MCGIAGVITNTTVDNIGIVRQMIANLAHRGPDGEGVWCQGNVAFGHKRLSIIDLEGGQQPLSDDTEKYTITYNGELYNFVDLKHELEGLGFGFRTKCDTEVILNAYIAWGQNCVKRFRGMFAFAIADLNKQRIFIARDHIGIKPLFYTEQNGIFAFGSELQALRPVEGLKFEIDPSALDDYLWLQYIPAPQTIFKNVKKLPPGHSMEVSLEGKANEPENYWNFSYKPDLSLDYNQWLEEVEHAIKNSVEKHLVSDVPFGAFLSGGVDSSLVVNYMSEIMDRPVDTFSIGFENQSFNELKYAEQVANKCGTKHHVEIVKTEGLEILPKLVRHYGEPFGDSSAIPTYYVCKMAAQQVKMVLSGDGGDEAFLGYESYQRWHDGRDYKGIPTWKRMLYPVGRQVSPHEYFSRKDYQYWIEINRYLPYEWRRTLWRKEYESYTKFRHPLFQELFNKTRNDGFMQKAQFADLNTYLPYDILTKVDVASMMSSLEVRTPLVDKEVWELVSRIPPSYHFHGNGKEWNGKKILKDILQKYFSKEFVNRPKMGFSVPIDQWMGFRNEDNIGFVNMFNDKSYLLEFFDETKTQDLLNNGQGKWKWLLLFLEFWLKDFYEGSERK